MNKISKQRELEQLAKLPDSQIDTSDIPEVANWNKAQQGRFYRPIKKQITLRVDVDTLTWFKEQGDKYQTRINAALREYMHDHRKVS